MNLSDNGLKKIESYEGYGKALPDGSCCAYQDRFNGHLDVPTIGFGCTENVTMGMVWSRAEADAAFRKELAKHEAAVNRLVTVDISQNQFDALTSFSYNCGIGALTKSTILKRLNKGDFNGAAKAFALFNKAGGAVVQGLVARRASEASLFLKPDVTPDKPAMPQTVTASIAPPSRPTVATVAAAVTAAATQIPILPALPPSVTESISNVNAWKDIGGQLWGLKDYALSHPTQSLVVTVPLLALWLWPKAKVAP